MYMYMLKLSNENYHIPTSTLFMPYANEQQRRRSACASVQSDQRLCCSLPGLYYTSTCYSQNFKPLTSLYNWAGWFESYLVEHPEDRFSLDEAHIKVRAFIWTDSLWPIKWILANSVNPGKNTIQMTTSVGVNTSNCQASMKLGSKYYDLLDSPHKLTYKQIYCSKYLHKVLERPNESPRRSWFHEVCSIKDYLLGSNCLKMDKLNSLSVCQKIFFQHQTSSCTSSICL